MTAGDLQPIDKRATLSREVTTPKKVTKAQIDSMFTAEVLTAFVKRTAKLTFEIFVFESDPDVYFFIFSSGKSFSSVLVLYSEFGISPDFIFTAGFFIRIPHNTEVIRRAIQIISPSILSDSIPAPIPVIRKAGPVLLQKASAREALSLSVLPDITRFAAAAAPAGYPVRFPSRKSTAQLLSILKILSNGTDISFPITSPAPLEVIRVEITRNGNKDGITVLTQS